MWRAWNSFKWRQVAAQDELSVTRQPDKVFEQMQRKFEPYVKCPDPRIFQVSSVSWVWFSTSANYCLDYQTSVLETSPAKTWSGTGTSPKREHLSNSKKQCLCHWYSVIAICERRLWSNVMRLNTVLVMCYFKVGSLNPYGRKLCTDWEGTFGDSSLCLWEIWCLHLWQWFC